MGEAHVLRVVLIEDDPTARKLLRDGLSVVPVEIDEAEDGQEGLALIEERSPDLVILDLVMPRVSGLGVLLALKKNPPKLRPRILVVSRVSSLPLVDRVLDLGADFYFQKPVCLDELLETIQALFPNPSPTSPVPPLRRSLADRLLEEMGAPEHLQGRRWLALAAEALAASETGHMLLKEAYYSAMCQGGTSYAAVDKNIRDVIRRIHAVHSHLYQAIMGGMPERCPSNGDFLRHLARELRRRTGREN